MDRGGKERENRSLISGCRSEPLASVASFDIVFDLVPIRYIA